jgi:hypothetical protein
MEISIMRITHLRQAARRAVIFEDGKAGPDAGSYSSKLRPSNR